MALTIQSTKNYKPKPRFLLYAPPGGAKTSLATTCRTPGENDILFAVTEGGIQTISHLDIPYVELRVCSDYDELVKMFKAGKRVGPGAIQVGNRIYRGIVVDLHSELVQMNLVEMVAESKASNQERDIDDPSQYEYKKLNFRIIRQIRELRNLPLQYVGFTAYMEEDKDKQNQIVKGRPMYVGSKIWVAVAGAVDYVFRISEPEKPSDSMKYRTIQTQPGPIYYAKARVPGVAGNLPLPAKIRFDLGHKTLLGKIFGKVDEYIAGQRLLEPLGPEPLEIQEEVSEADSPSTPNPMTTP